MQLLHMLKELDQDAQGVPNALDANDMEKWDQIVTEIGSASENDLNKALDYIFDIIMPPDVTIPEDVERAWWDIAHEIRDRLPAAEQRAAGESSGFFPDTEKGERS